jgi:hypothetical protein
MEFGLILGGTLLLMIPEETLYSFFGLSTKTSNLPECLFPLIIPLLGCGLIAFGVIMKYKHILLGCSRGMIDGIEHFASGLLRSSTSTPIAVSGTPTPQN